MLVAVAYASTATPSKCGKPLKFQLPTDGSKDLSGPRLMAVPNGNNVENTWAIRSQARRGAWNLFHNDNHTCAVKRLNVGGS
jgi:hypothetical protein